MSKNYVDKMKFTTQYIGKPKKKKDIAKDVLKTEIPASWQEAFTQLSQSIGHIGNAVGNLTGETVPQMQGSNVAYHGVPNWQWNQTPSPDWTYRPDPNMYTIKPAIHPINKQVQINWDLIGLGAPTSRFFIPSTNGVFFPC